MKKICNLLKIPILTNENLDFRYSEKTLSDQFKKELLTKAKYIALVYAKASSESQERILESLNTKISKYSFYSSENLSLGYKNKNDEQIYNEKIYSWYDDDNNFYYAGRWNSPITLYELCDCLCDFFGTIGIEKNLSVILQLPEQELIGWLTEKGYSIEKKLEPTIQSEPYAGDDLKEKNEDQCLNPAIFIEGYSSEESFKKEIEATLVNTDDVQIEVRTKIDSVSVVPENYHKIENKKIRKDIGRWSEELVFNLLKKKFNETAIVVWENESGESGKPYDLKLELNAKVKYIEVKGTPSSTKGELYLLKNEWKFMFEQGENYSIYRLYNAGKTNGHRIDEIKNPCERIKTADLLPDTITMIV